MTYQNYRLCHGCRTTWTNQGQEVNGIFYCNSCASIRGNNRQIAVSLAENIPSSTLPVVRSSSNLQSAVNVIRSSDNSSQNSSNSALFSFLRKYPIIILAAVIFIFVSIAKINNKENLSENQTKIQSSSQTKKNPSNEIVNEKFTISKYVSPAGLNARSGPDMSYKSLFVIPQNEIVYLSSTRHEGVWYIIKYKDKIGWVNKTFLREFKVDSIKIGNHDDNGHWITRPGENLHASQMEHLGVELTFVTLNNYSQNTNILLKIIGPKSYIQGSKVPSGFSEQWNIKLQSGTFSYGTFSIPGYYYKYRPGLWRIELYHENPNNRSNTLACIATKQFTLY